MRISGKSYKVTQITSVGLYSIIVEVKSSSSKKIRFNLFSKIQ